MVKRLGSRAGGSRAAGGGRRASGRGGIPTGRWASFKVLGNETSWVCLGLFALLALVVLSAHGVRPESRLVFLMELGFPLLSAPLLVPAGLLDRDYGMLELFNAAATPSSVRIGRRLAQVLLAPVCAAVPAAMALAALPRVGSPVVSAVTVGLSGAALAVFMGGAAVALALLTGSLAAGYAASPAVVVATISLKGFIPRALQPFPVAATLGRSLALVAVEPISGPGLFWLNRAGYVATGLVLMALALVLRERTRWGY